jgi:hypothetical protein
MWLVVVQEWGNEIRASQRAKLSIAWLLAPPRSNCFRKANGNFN